MTHESTITRPRNSGTDRPQMLLFRRHLEHLQLTLQPLLSVSTGQSHPAFPATLLHYHLLTEDQLDDLAHWYHQRTPGPLSLSYPAPVVARWHRGARRLRPGIGNGIQRNNGYDRPSIHDKRRRFGRFIGLRGCESPRGDGGGEDPLIRLMRQKMNNILMSSSTSSPPPASPPPLYTPASPRERSFGQLAERESDAPPPPYIANPSTPVNHSADITDVANVTDVADVVDTMASRTPTSNNNDDDDFDVNQADETEYQAWLEARMRRQMARDAEREVWRAKGF